MIGEVLGINIKWGEYMDIVDVLYTSPPVDVPFIESFL